MSRKPQPREAQLNLPTIPDLMQSLFLDTTDGILCADAQGRYIEANPRLCDLLGYSREELLNLSVAESLQGGELGASELPLILARPDASSQGKEYRLRRKDGAALYVEISARPLSEGIWLGIVRDITERRQSEDKLKRLTRLYATLSQTNQAIVRTRNREELFQTICNVAVEFGKFHMAWIGLLDQESGQFVPVAHAGHEDGYLQFVNINIRDESRSAGPIDSALRSGKIVTVNDIETDLRMAPWREEALKHGYHSSAAMPFRLQNNVIGTLNLYGGEPGFFTHDEESLLEEIGLDISFALDSMEVEARRAQTEDALRESEDRYHFLFDTMLDGFALHEIICDETGRPVDYRFLQVNPAFERLTGLHGDEIVGKTAREVLPGIETFWIDTYGQVSLTGTPAYFESYSQALGKYYQVAAYSPRRGWFATVFEDITQRRETEQALRESEAKFRSYIEHAPLAVFVSDSSGRYIDCNPAATELLGYDAATLMTMSIPDIILPEDRGVVLHDFKILISEGKLEREYRMLRQDGQLVWVLLRAVMIAGECALAFCKDISERKQAEAALRASEARYRLLAENTGDVIWMLDIGASRFEYVSPSVSRLRGYTVEEVLAQAFPETMTPASYAMLQSKLPKRLSDFLAGDASAVTRVEEVEQTRKDGSTVWTEVVTTFIKDAEGSVKVLGVSRDISQRKKAAEALRESEERFRSMAEQMVDVLFVTGTNGIIGYISPSAADVFGWTPEEMVGQNFTRFLVPSEIPHAMAKFQADIERGQPSRGLELMMKRKDGSTFWGELNAGARRRNGQAIDVIGLIRDISERKSAERVLHESEARYRAIVEDQTELIIRWLPDTTLTFTNEAFCRFIGLPREQLLGQRFLLAISSEDRESVEKIVIMLSQEHPVLESEQRMQLLDKEVRWVQWTNRALFDEQGRVAEIQSAGRDITERKRMDMELQVRTNELEALFALSSALNIAQTESAMLPAILAEVNRALGADASWLALYDPDRAEFRVALASGDLAPNVGRTFSSLEGLDVQRLMSGQPYIVDEFGKAGRQMGVITDTENLGPAVFAPVQSQEQFLGIMAAMRRKGAPNYDASAIRMLAVGGEMVGNALHRVRLHDQALVRLQHLQILQRIVSAITGSFDLTFTLPMLADEITSQTRVDAAAVLLFNPHTLMLEYATGRGFRSRSIEKTRVRLGEGFAGRAALQHTIISSDDLYTEAEAAGGDAFGQWARTESFVAYNGVPLIVKGQVKGVLELFHRTPLPSDTEWFDFLKTLAHQAAIAIDNVELFEGVQRSNLELALAYDATIEGWSRAMDLRDRDTEGHTLRVTEMTERLARAFGMSEAEIVNVRRGALLHDIGKMGVPDSILHKPGKLNDEEWEIMHRHPQYAYDMLMPITYLRPALDIPYCHHEKWDGTGYPRGLKGDQIPLAARVFAVVDVWDALISDRPYRPAWPANRVREHIHKGAGTHFDPQIVEAFFKLNSGGSGMSEGALQK